MRMLIRTSALIVGLAMGTTTILPGQLKPAETWNLPQAPTVKDNGPRTYRFEVDYNTANTKGELVYRQRVTGEYTRGLYGGDVMWKNVTLANAVGATASFDVPQKSDFMEGFRYRGDAASTMRPDFFKGFPPNAVMQRNLVWDTGMIEMFGQSFFDKLKLNEPYQVLSNQEVKIPDMGTFRNHSVMLEWIGRSLRNGQECALIKYEAFFNPLRVATGGFTLTGNSNYWGEIWVSLETRQIEYSTINESVVGEMKLAGQDTPQTLNIFRSGTFEPVDAQQRTTLNEASR
jgi:hypothetical protein